MRTTQSRFSLRSPAVANPISSAGKVASWIYRSDVLALRGGGAAHVPDLRRAGGEYRQPPSRNVS